VRPRSETEQQPTLANFSVYSNQLLTSKRHGTLQASRVTTALKPHVKRHRRRPAMAASQQIICYNEPADSAAAAAAGNDVDGDNADDVILAARQPAVDPSVSQSRKR